MLDMTHDTHTPTTAITDALTDILDARAAKAASAMPATLSDAALATLWHDVTDALQDAGLSAVIPCHKTGIICHRLDAADYRAALTAIHALGDSRQADDALYALLAAITTMQGHTVAPAAVCTSGQTLATEAVYDPASYIMRGLSTIWPVPARACSLTRARYACHVAEARSLVLAMPDADKARACSYLHTYLSHVLPSRLASDRVGDLRRCYTPDAARDLRHVVSQGLPYLCASIIDAIGQLISKHRVQPLDALTASDVASLRVHYRGADGYRVQQAARREHAKAAAQERRKAAKASRLTARQRSLVDDADLAGWELGDIGAIDMPVALQGQAEAEQEQAQEHYDYEQEQAEAEEQEPDYADEADDMRGLGLSCLDDALAALDADPDAYGYAYDDEADDDYDYDDEDEDEDEALTHAMAQVLAAQQAHADQQAEALASAIMQAQADYASQAGPVGVTVRISGAAPAAQAPQVQEQAPQVQEQAPAVAPAPAPAVAPAPAPAVQAPQAGLRIRFAPR